jgi:hypothetical protein
MSTLCRAKWELRNVRSARPFYRAAARRRRTRSLGGASRAAPSVQDVFGGTPDTARETHALPTHLSAFLKSRGKGCRKISDNQKYFGNISEKQSFSEIISDYFLGKGSRLNQGQSKRIKVNQSDVGKCQRLKAEG